MPRPDSIPKLPMTRPASALAKRDEAEQRLLEACRSRYPPPGFEVGADASHIVWVKDTASKRSVGLQPWLLRDHTPDEVLHRADARLGLPA